MNVGPQKKVILRVIVLSPPVTDDVSSFKEPVWCSQPSFVLIRAKGCDLFD